MPPTNPWQQQPGQPPYGNQPPATPPQPGMVAPQPGSPYPGQPVQYAPQVPYFLQEDPSAPPPPPARNNLKVVVVGLLIAVVVMGSLYILLGGANSAGKSSPDSLFTTALNTALSTSSYKLQETKSKSKVVLSVDAGDVKDVKTSASVTLDNGSIAVVYDGSATYGESYIRYDELANETLFLTDTSLAGQWIQLRSAGTLPNAYTASLDKLYDPNIAFLDGFPMGNFPAADRAAILNYISAQHVYSYDATKVTSGSIGSQPVKIYTITTSRSKLSGLRQKIGSATGVSSQAIAAADESDAFPTKFTLYVDATTGQPLRISSKQSDGTLTIDYAGYNSTKVPGAPLSSTQWGDEQAKLQAESKTGELAAIQTLGSLSSQFTAQ